MFVEGENSVFFYSFFVFGFLAEREPEGEMGKRKREEEEGERREKKKTLFCFFPCTLLLSVSTLNTFSSRLFRRDARGKSPGRVYFQLNT